MNLLCSKRGYMNMSPLYACLALVSRLCNTIAILSTLFCSYKTFSGAPKLMFMF